MINEHPDVILFVIGTVNTLALFIASAVLISFRRTIDALKVEDREHNKRIGQLEIAVRGLEVANEERVGAISRIEKKLDYLTEVVGKNSNALAAIKTRFDNQP